MPKYGYSVISLQARSPFPRSRYPACDKNFLPSRRRISSSKPPAQSPLNGIDSAAKLRSIYLEVIVTLTYLIFRVGQISSQGRKHPVDPLQRSGGRKEQLLRRMSLETLLRGKDQKTRIFIGTFVTVSLLRASDNRGV